MLFFSVCKKPFEFSWIYSSILSIESLFFVYIVLFETINFFDGTAIYVTSLIDFNYSVFIIFWAVADLNFELVAGRILFKGFSSV